MVRKRRPSRVLSPPLAIRIPGSGVLASGLLRRLWCSHGWGFREPLARTVPLLKAPAWGFLSPARRAEVWVSDRGLGRRQSWVGSSAFFAC